MTGRTYFSYRNVLRFIRKAEFVLNWLVYGLVRFVPRRKKMWVYIGWHESERGDVFADNAKYLFLYAAKNLPSVEVVWIAREEGICRRLRERGYRAYSVHTWKGRYYSMRAGFTFVDAYLKREHWRLSAGSRVVQLWHGKGPKKVGVQNANKKKERTSLSARIISPHLFVTYEFLIAYSPYAAELIAESFGYSVEKVLVTGLPKYDGLTCEIPGMDIDAHPQLKKVLSDVKKTYDKVILYAPTFREGGANPFDSLDFNKLNEVLKEKNYFLMGMLHPKFAKKEWSGGSGLSNISFLEPGYDSNPFLKYFDLLITDYSSMSVDFLWIGRPVLYYVPDIEKYQGDTGLYQKFWDMLPGKRVTTEAELLNALGEFGEVDKELLLSAQKHMFTQHDCKSSERVANHTFTLLR